MGPVQSSLNSLMGAAWGSVASIALLSKKGALGKHLAEKNKENTPKVETSGSMGNNVKIGRLQRNAYAKSTAYLSADNMINEKASSLTFSVDNRIAQASSLSVGGMK